MEVDRVQEMRGNYPLMPGQNWNGQVPHITVAANIPKGVKYMCISY